MLDGKFTGSPIVIMGGFRQKENRAGNSKDVMPQTPTTPTFLVTGPNDPPAPGFSIQMRSPLPGATPKSKLTCGFLNKLQLATFVPTNFPLAGLFTSVVPVDPYRSTFNSAAEIAHASGMSALPHFQRIEITVSTCAITKYDYRCYRITALCQAYDRNGKLVSFKGYNGAHGFMSVKVVHDWCRHVRDFRGIEDSENMTWADLMIVLRESHEEELLCCEYY